MYHVSLAVHVYMDGVMKEVKIGMGGRGVRFLEDGRVEIVWPLVCRSLGSIR